MSLKTITLRPIKESTEDYDAVEARIKALFRELVYEPIMAEMGISRARARLTNAKWSLLDAIRSGSVTFSMGKFSGSFDATVSRELKALGAEWDKSKAAWKIPQAELPEDVRHVISVSEAKFRERLARIDDKLAQNLPAKIAENLKISKLFDRTLTRTETDFQKSIANITVAPKLSPEARRRVATEWEKNTQLWIEDFAEKEILQLRSDVKAAVLSGNRYGSLVKSIQDSYGVTQRKAKFLARQETSLLMTKFKQVRYQSAGVNEYKWACVAGSPMHPVRPWHRELEKESNAGRIFTWDNPPVVSAPGEPIRRANPGQDFNCRCFARPVVRFRV